ncbi:hypothetical protein [Brucella oryzae]|uniref:Uncharacterized protein n=1 Tax=Brucella oryzae TaxID=335286 RepID=A0A2S7IV33_9HYPH|nr:hypothetical protein [Brucella oryzae]MBR7653329.1 hypothetical protein [Brucella oryzae]PQA71790.1 hypothetical protein C3731_20140 [Brucella oryzae]
MPLERIHLHKILKLLFSSAPQRRSLLLRDLRLERAKEEGREANGPDFYTPFWSDVRAHIFGGNDLHESTEGRIIANPRSRKDLYPKLRDGFLRWWIERRRWTNEPFRPGRHLKSSYTFAELGATVKVEGVLSVRDARSAEHFIYPYFGSDPALSDEAAKLGLWLLIQALPEVLPTEIRILDIIRGQTFSVDRLPLSGNEEAKFQEQYRKLIDERNALLAG